MTDSNRYSNVEVDEDYVDYLGDEAERLAEEYEQEQERQEAADLEWMSATTVAYITAPSAHSK